ncbi:Fc.00g105130.m01.CDS01 [Cosmosporella sp. VM-42]
MEGFSLSLTDAGLEARYIPVSELPTTPLQQGAIAIIFLMTFLAFTVWGIRIYSRVTTKQLGIDDWLTTAAMVCSLGMLVPNYMFFKYDYTGFPTPSLPATYDIEPVLFWNWIMQVLYNPILALVKASVLIFLLRLGGHRRSIRWCIYALNIFNAALGVAIFLTVLFQTIPINAYWDLSIEKKRQIDGPLFYISTAIITIGTDFLVLILPFWVFVGLKMRLAAKVGLIVVFLLGGVVTIVAIVRVNELRKKFYDLDPNYDSRNTLGDTLSSVEVNLAILASCGPALRPLFRRMFPGLFSNKSSNDRGNYPTPSNYGTGTGLRHTTNGGSFPLKDMHVSKTHTEIRGHSPNGSEEEIMTYNGIIRTTAVNIKYDQATLSDRDGPEYSDPVHSRSS